MYLSELEFSTDICPGVGLGYLIFDKGKKPFNREKIFSSTNGVGTVRNSYAKT